MTAAATADDGARDVASVPDDRGGEHGEGGSFRARVLRIVRAVPRGRVVTYGHVALLAGSPRAARQVGGALHGARALDDVPWQRVVNVAGGISTHKIGAGELQEALLRSEGVEVGPEGVDLARYGWRPDAGSIAELAGEGGAEAGCG